VRWVTHDRDATVEPPDEDPPRVRVWYPRAPSCSARRARRCPIRIAAPKETHAGERRVAITPESAKKLIEKGFEVALELGAGEGAGFPDASYTEAGATLVSRDEALAAPLVLKVRPPSEAEARALGERSMLVSHLYPDRHPALMPILLERRVTTLALERVPRVTRAQKMDVLSSMGNLLGYRAVIEASASFGGFFGAQVTAAGSSRPARVLVIGAGVAGLAAVGAARGLGAEVRAFDTRAAAREQVESLGATFLEVDLREAGEGQGGYAKVMSKEFIEAEMKLFREQAREVDVIITTALVPGTKAPILVPEDVVACLRPGSIVVDLAAEQGGNCALTKPGEAVVWNGVTILGYTDLPSRMAGTSSRLFATNLVHLVAELCGGAQNTASDFGVDLDNDVVRPALVTHEGMELPPPAKKEPSPAASAGAKPAPEAEAKPAEAPKQDATTTGRSRPPPPHDAKPKQHNVTAPPRKAWTTNLVGTLIVVGLFVLGRFAPGDFLQHFTVFILACFVGWQVIWSVTPALHTPLMSVTNAISGIIVIGGMLQISGALDGASSLGALAVLFAAINVAGGFLVTQRMLRMFRRQ
jgi:NAD(P) transhydrogenase subunit alpha